MTTLTLAPKAILELIFYINGQNQLSHSQKDDRLVERVSFSISSFDNF